MVVWGLYWSNEYGKDYGSVYFFSIQRFYNNPPKLRRSEVKRGIDGWWLETYKQIWQKMFVVFGGKILSFFYRGPQRNLKSSFFFFQMSLFFFLLAEFFFLFLLLACYPTPLPFPKCRVCPFSTPLLADVLSQIPYLPPMFCYTISANLAPLWKKSISTLLTRKAFFV